MTQAIKLLHYRNGTYQGQVKQNKRNGKGILITDNGQILVGTWKNDKLYGYGLTLLNSNEYSYGEFNRGDLQGWSKFQSPDKVLISQFNANRAINKQLLIDKNNFTFTVCTPAQNSIYQSLKEQQLPQNFNPSLSLDELCSSQLQAKLPAHINYTLADYLIECYKKDDIFQTQLLLNGYLMFRVKDQTSVINLGFVVNKNSQLVSYGSYINNKLNGYGCKFENAVRYEGIFENGFLNGLGLKFVSGKYSFGTFQNGTLTNPIYLQERSPASEQKLTELKKFNHITNLNFTNIYLPQQMLKFKGTKQIIFQISSSKQQYHFNKTLQTTSPNKKPVNIASILLANREENDAKSSVSIMTNKKVTKNIDDEDSRISEMGKSVSNLNSRFKN